MFYNLKTGGYGDLTPQGEIPYPVISILTKHYKMNKDQYNNIYLENRLLKVSHLLSYGNMCIRESISTIISKSYQSNREKIIINKCIRIT